MTTIRYITNRYAFAGCRRCKAPGMQSYDVVLQMPGNEADAVPWERIQKKNGAFELPRNENIAFDDHSIPEFDLDRF